MTAQNETLNQILWGCRRGMLELDMLLIPFCEKHYLTLSTPEQQAFQTLLSHEDPTLFAWFTGEVIPEDENLQELVKMIKTNVKYSP